MVSWNFGGKPHFRRYFLLHPYPYAREWVWGAFTYKAARFPVLIHEDLHALQKRVRELQKAQEYRSRMLRSGRDAAERRCG